VGAGKAAAAMAAALEEAWPDVPLAGLVAVPRGYEVPTNRIAVMKAGHPVPDASSETAARHMLEAVRGLGPDDLVLALMSGGGSAALALPAGSLTLEDKQAVNRALLASGASIRDMNLVRRHLSAIKGGHLARAAQPARVVTLAISDVPGDDAAVIASGPTVPGTGGWVELEEVILRLGLDLPSAVMAHFETLRHAPPPLELPAPDVRLIATPMMALQAAAAATRDLGLTALILGDALEGESRELGRILAGIALSVRRHSTPATAPVVLLSGGEATVTLGGYSGRGGPNQECALSLAVALDGAPGIWALAGDTDGIDGTDDAAGAMIGPDTLERARSAGFDPALSLAAHDSYNAFARLGDLIHTGPTLTNVNDFRAVLIG
jgi:glycerate 2-kinase